MLINPWIYDFAAFDLWQKPIGLLYLGAILKEIGWSIDLIDCLDRYDPDLIKTAKTKDKKFYTGKYLKQYLNKPEPIKHIPRKYSRYGLPDNLVENKLSNIKEPEIILITLGMTYWYPSLIDIIDLIKEYFPDKPIMVGGVYATLAEEHAKKYISADIFGQGECENKIFDLLPDNLKPEISPRSYNDIDDLPFPLYELYDDLRFLPLLTSRGCPLRCSFCASYKLNGIFRKRSVDSVFDEIKYSMGKYDLKDIAFYDDALLTDKEEHILPILEKVIHNGFDLNFHSPNGIQAELIDDTTAEIMFKAAFKTVRLSLETVSEKRIQVISKKVSPDGFSNAVNSLEKAGYKRSDIEAYLLMGLPGDNIYEVIDTLYFVAENGVLSRLSTFSPIPHTKDWNRLVDHGIINEEMDLLETNNSVFLYKYQDYSIEIVDVIKNHVKYLNDCVRKNEKIPDKLLFVKQIEKIRDQV
ncbi:B12-binding domain-containing radical SAM protein [candidate division KSB1 bacterium]